MEKVFDAILGDTFTIKPKRFISFVDRNRGNIKEVKFISPRMGGRGFGHFQVVVKNPYAIKHSHGRTYRSESRNHAAAATEVR